MVTERQRDVFAFILAYAGENYGMAPSYSEMAKAIGIKSNTGIHRIVLAL